MANKCFSGLHMAEVIDVTGDKDKLNRIKTKLVSEGDNGIELDHAPVLTNSAGKDYGIVSLPKKGDFVIVAFLDNDMQRPVILGSVPTPTKKPPIEVKQDNTIRTHKTAGGMEITIDENEKTPKITFKTKSEHVFTWEDSSNKNLISLKSKDGKTAISIDLKKSVIELKADTIKLTADSKEVAIKSRGSSANISNSKGVEIKSPKGKFAVNANSIDCKATSTAKFAANAEINVQGSGGANLKSNGITQVGGSLVKIG